jgi:hypothetical protein
MDDQNMIAYSMTALKDNSSCLWQFQTVIYIATYPYYLSAKRLLPDYFNYPLMQLIKAFINFVRNIPVKNKVVSFGKALQKALETLRLKESSSNVQVAHDDSLHCLSIPQSAANTRDHMRLYVSACSFNPSMLL